MKLIQVNLNHFWADPDQLTGITDESALQVVTMSEHYKNPSNNGTDLGYAGTKLYRIV